VKRLVVTADDVGLHPGMTAGALAAHDRGVVTACSVAPCGADFPAAVRALAARPALDVGIHLALVGERPLSPLSEVRSLVGGDGRFPHAWTAFLARYLARSVSLDEVEREWRRQIARLGEAGLAPVHLNSHQHLHALPRLFRLAVRLAREHGIPFVRLPSDPAAERRLGARALAVRGLGATARRARHHLESAGEGPAPSLEATVGILVAGRLDLQRLLALLGGVRGRAELVCHPGTGDADLERATRWGYRWETETSALCDAAVRASLATHGIELARFSALAAEAQDSP
jgi:predicted glycoside hydrolase/deacetylase ChbG (UPF0249 family)